MASRYPAMFAEYRPHEKVSCMVRGVAQPEDLKEKAKQAVGLLDSRHNRKSLRPSTGYWRGAAMLASPTCKGTRIDIWPPGREQVARARHRS